MDGAGEGTGDARNPRAEHVARRDALTAEARALEARSDKISGWRGVTFLVSAGGASAVFFAHLTPLLWAPVAAVGAVFVALVVRHALLVTRSGEILARTRLVDAAIARIDHAWAKLSDQGARFSSTEHAYASDLDVFGDGSLFQLVSSAHTARGEKTLAGWLLAAAPPDVVGARQVAVRELAKKRAFREELERAASRAGTSGLEDDPLAAWAERLDDGVPLHRLALAKIGRVMGPITVGLFAASELTPPAMSTAFRVAAAVSLTLQLGLLAALRGRLESPLALLRAKDSPFSAYLELVRLVEAERFEAPLLVATRERLTAGSPATRELARLARILSWAELRHNALAHLVINGLVLWDVHSASALERWRVEAGPRVAAWVDALAEIEALASLGGFADDHPDFAFVELGDGAPALEAEALGHPLLADDKRVANDVAIGGDAAPRALLVTGSNMSGKSTLLRAIGINAVLAQSGAPCCARRLAMTPLAVHTSMRVADSLKEGVSHFYAELARLKSVVDAADDGERVLFLLDEVLHGTNSRERQIGAKSVAIHLCDAGAIGALSSHDLGLAGLEEESGGRVASVHFEEQVQAGKMSFDYALRPGVVTSGNALRLMRDLGLPVPPED